LSVPEPLTSAPPPPAPLPPPGEDVPEESSDGETPGPSGSTTPIPNTAASNTATQQPAAAAAAPSSSTPLTSKKRDKTSKLELAVQEMANRIKTCDAMDSQMAKILEQLTRQSQDPVDTWISWLAAEARRIHPDQWRNFQAASLDFMSQWTTPPNPQAGPSQPTNQPLQPQPLLPYPDAFMPTSNYQGAMGPPPPPSASGSDSFNNNINNISLSHFSALFPLDSPQRTDPMDTSGRLSTPHMTPRRSSSTTTSTATSTATSTSDVIRDARVVVETEPTTEPILVLSHAEGATAPVVTSVQSHTTRIPDKVVAQSEQPTIVSVMKKDTEEVVFGEK